VSFEQSRAPEPVLDVADEPDSEPVEVPDPELRLVEVPAPEVPPPAEPEPAEPEPAEPAPAEPEPAEPLPAAADPDLSLRVFAWTAAMTVSVLLAIVSLALTVYAIAGGGF
jgi:hypothetical protein